MNEWIRPCWPRVYPQSFVNAVLEEAVVLGIERRVKKTILSQMTFDDVIAWVRKRRKPPAGKKKAA